MLFVVVPFPSPILFISFFVFLFRHGGFAFFFFFFLPMWRVIYSKALILFYITLSYYTFTLQRIWNTW